MKDKVDSETHETEPLLDELRREMHQAFEAIRESCKWQPERSCIILSGGLDTSIVAEIGKEILGFQAAVTVLVEDSGTDQHYAAAIADKMGLQHTVIRLTLDELVETQIPDTIKVLQSFDPMSIRNNCICLAAMKKIKELGFTCAVTGDGADEIFSGYSFTHNMPEEQWLEHRQHITSIMSFDSILIGNHFGISVFSPFLQPNVIECALKFNLRQCVKEIQVNYEGVGGPLLTMKTGKMPLRLAFPHVYSTNRRKDPLEVGSGSSPLRTSDYFEAKIDDQAFQAGQQSAAQQGFHFMPGKENLYYFRLFAAAFPAPDSLSLQGWRVRHGAAHSCPKCGFQLDKPQQTFCITCGFYDQHMNRKKQ